MTEKDKNGKLMKVGGEYNKKVRKMLYVEYDYELFDRYKFDNSYFKNIWSHMQRKRI